MGKKSGLTMYVEFSAVSKAKMAQKRRDYFVQIWKNLVLSNRIFPRKVFKLYFKQPQIGPKSLFSTTLVFVYQNFVFGPRR